MAVAEAQALWVSLVGTRKGEPQASTQGSGLPPKLVQTWDSAQVRKTVDTVPALKTLAQEERFWDASRKRYEAERAVPLQLLLIAGRGDPGDLRLGGGVAVTFPMTRRYQGEIARAEAERERSQTIAERYRSIVQQRLELLAEFYPRLLTALETLDSQGIPAAERTVDISLEGYKRGKVDLVQTFIARRDLAQLRARRLDLAASAWRQYGELTAIYGDLP